MKIIKTISDTLEAVRSKKPLVHSLTNYVVMNETANAALCIGALPIMAHAKEEMEEMVAISNALVLNIGTLSSDWIDSMIVAGKKANQMNIPVVLDPVGAGATTFRTDMSKKILDNIKISIVRGNAAEVASLAGICAEVKGVESMGADASNEDIALKFASTYNTIAAITGVVDIVSNGKECAKISNGDAMMGKVVGTGCISTVITGAFAAVESDPYLAAISALTVYGVAGELAAKVSGDKPGTFHVELYNALYSVCTLDIEKKAKVLIS